MHFLIKLLTIISLIISLWMCILRTVNCAEINDTIIQKDLYKILGVKQQATISEIKKAFRKLAQIHHPDKSKKSNKELNEAIFREIAEAYEILSSTEDRSTYDEKRKNFYLRESKKEQFKPSSSSYDGEYEEFMRNTADSLKDFQRMFERAFSAKQNLDETFHFQPILVGPVVSSNQFFYPFNPIMTFHDKSVFAFLDNHCSLIVCKGNIEDLLHYISTTNDYDVTYENIPLDIQYRSKNPPVSPEYCYGVLNELGEFEIFSGQPYHPDRYRIWTSHRARHEQDSSFYSSFYTRYFMELSKNGELFIRKITPGNNDAQCVWASTSCDERMAFVIMKSKEALKIVRSLWDKWLIKIFLFDDCMRKSFTEWTAGNDVFMGMWNGISKHFTHFEGFTISIYESFLNQIYKFWNDILHQLCKWNEGFCQAMNFYPQEKFYY